MMQKILITGASGFIGKRLVYQLLEQGHLVYFLVRNQGILFKFSDHPNARPLYGDMEFLETCEKFPVEIDAAYYLLHSMGSDVQNLAQIEASIAKNFVSLIEKTQCKQIIFLGGIIEDEKHLSPHLSSRLGVEKVLQSSQIPCTVLRASLIIGAGSASFEIIRDLVEKLPFMVAPKWVQTLCQPIAIRDVLFYLTHVLLRNECYGKTYDIGGPDVMSFKDALLRYARFRKLKRFILNVPVLTPRLSSYWLVLITSVRFSICRYLVESMRHNTRKLNGNIDSLVEHSCICYEKALELAFQKIAQNEVVSTWMDAWNFKGNIQKYIEVPEEGCLKDSQKLKIDMPIELLKKRIWSLGGKTGWYSMNWAWKLRGLIDQLVGGTGLRRGRRDTERLQAGDPLDFWRVLLADEKKGHLILYAEMKMPGEAWLEFSIDEEKRIFKQTATFRPKGFWGRIYWYTLFPFHVFIFKNMAKSIVKMPADKSPKSS